MQNNSISMPLIMQFIYEKFLEKAFTLTNLFSKLCVRPWNPATTHKSGVFDITIKHASTWYSCTANIWTVILSLRGKLFFIDHIDTFNYPIDNVIPKHNVYVNFQRENNFIISGDCSTPHEDSLILIYNRLVQSYSI